MLRTGGTIEQLEEGTYFWDCQHIYPIRNLVQMHYFLSFPDGLQSLCTHMHGALLCTSQMDHKVFCNPHHIANTEDHTNMHYSRSCFVMYLKIDLSALYQVVSLSCCTLLNQVSSH